LLIPSLSFTDVWDPHVRVFFNFQPPSYRPYAVAGLLRARRRLPGWSALPSGLQARLPDVEDLSGGSSSRTTSRAT
jgi:hypothetical protein